LIRWSIQEVRRIAIRLARKRIQPAHIIAWSLRRRAHQAVAQRDPPHQGETATVMLTPAEVPLIDAEFLFRQPGPVHAGGDLVARGLAYLIEHYL
jgi:hypothetical protein